mgnify:CR=1 FL=1
MLCELKRRWVSVTEQFRKRQAEAIAGVTSKRDLGLTALLVVLTQWGDTCYPYAVGAAPCYSIFPAQPGHLITIDEVPTMVL